MKSNVATVERVEVGYKQRLISVKRMLAKQRESHHERASILVAVFNDRDFRADLGNVDDFRAADALDEYCEGMDGLNFLQVRSVLEFFPAKADWTGKRLGVLYAEMRERQREASRDDKPPREVHRVTREQYDALADEKQHAESRAKFLDQEIKQTKTTLEQLQEENARLKQELARANGRIEQLEKMLST